MNHASPEWGRLFFAHFKGTPKNGIIFTVFTKEGNPYRSKGYKFSLKDKEGHWNSELKDGCYTFDFPINKQFLITDPGNYRFQIEYRMPITPLVGIKELKLINNN